MIDPRGETARSWTAKTGALIATYGTAPVIADEAAWPLWAATVAGFPALAAVGVTPPLAVADWRSWAMQFNQVVGTLGLS